MLQRAVLYIEFLRGQELMQNAAINLATSSRPRPRN